MNLKYKSDYLILGIKLFDAIKIYILQNGFSQENFILVNCHEELSYLISIRFTITIFDFADCFSCSIIISLLCLLGYPWFLQSSHIKVKTIKNKLNEKIFFKSLLRTYTLLIKYVYTDEILFCNSSSSFQICPLTFIFFTFFLEPSNLIFKFFTILLIFIWLGFDLVAPTFSFDINTSWQIVLWRINFT